MENDNLQIIDRMMEVAQNESSWQLFPTGFKNERLWLSNVLNDVLDRYENEFRKEFETAVRQYKHNLQDNKEYGWFYSPENLCWAKMSINQLKYIIYGDRFSNEDLIYREELGKDSYKDLINQIDRTVLMTDKERQRHTISCNRIANKIVSQLLKKQKTNQQPKRQRQNRK